MDAQLAVRILELRGRLSPSCQRTRQRRHGDGRYPRAIRTEFLGNLLRRVDLAQSRRRSSSSDNFSVGTITPVSLIAIYLLTARGVRLVNQHIDLGNKAWASL